jgi:ABC-type multidrug transport system ATPase subunit
MSLAFRDVQVELAGKRVLDLPELRAERGQITGLLGDNGAGKTTLLHAAAGILDLARGEILLDGERFHHGRAPAPKKLRQKTALVLQEPLLLSRQVERAVGFGLRARGVPREERTERVRKTLDRLGLSHLASRGERELSGGERRLAAFAAAVVVEPGLLLLDEVTSGLDDAAIERVEREIKALSEGGTTVLLTTHQSEHASRLAHRTVRLRAGQLV